MSKYGSSQFKLFLVGGYNLLAAKVQGVTRRIENVLVREDGLGDEWDEYRPIGRVRATLTQEGAFFDTATSSIHDALKSVPKVSRVVVLGERGNTVGARFTGFAGALAVSYEVLSQLEGLTKANAEYGISGQVDEDGVILQPLEALTANETGDAVDHGASSANGGVGYLQVSAFSGFASVAVTVQHSADGNSWVDLVTFANVTAGPTAERIAVAGTVNRFVRSLVTVSGTGSITVFVGFVRH